jgi:hypothetical protein
VLFDLSDFFDHIDGSAGTFFSTYPASFAIVIIYFVPLPGSQFDNGVIRAHPITRIALKAIPAREASSGFE